MLARAGAGRLSGSSLGRPNIVRADRIVRLFAISVAAAAVLWFCVFGLPPRLTLSASERSSYDQLRSARYFAGPAVGIAGDEPPESKALRSLLSRREGGKAFKYLLFTGTPAGKLYGLVGLRHTNPVLFAVAVQPFRLWPGNVETIFGCVGE